jgi:hypothetical protein
MQIGLQALSAGRLRGTAIYVDFRRQKIRRKFGASVG